MSAEPYSEYNNAEIKVNLRHIFKFFLRNKYLIFIISFLSIIIGFVKVNSMDKVWKGEFTIVLAPEAKSSASSTLGNLLNLNNSGFAMNLLGSKKGGVENDLVILKSFILNLYFVFTV